MVAGAKDLPISQMQHFTASAHYTLGYTRPNNEDLGFEGRHGAAYIIQSRYRIRQRRREWLRAKAESDKSLSDNTLNEIVSTAARRRRQAMEAPAVELPTTTRGKMWAFFNDPSSSLLAYIFAVVILIVICFSCCVFVIQTLPQFHARHEDLFWWMECGCVVVFTVEFCGRVVSCPDLHKFTSDFLNWIDLMAIVPFYIELILKSGGGAGGLATLRLVRLARVFRLFKLGKNSKLVGVFAGTLRQSVRPMITMCMFVVCGVVIIASIMYYVERGRFACACAILHDSSRRHACGMGDLKVDADPVAFEENEQWKLANCVTDDEVGYWLTDAGGSDGSWSKSPFQDIPSACYFALVTMTTVGYGDVAPKSAIGQAFASMFCVLGVIIIALPISVISANFKKNFFEHENDKKEGIGVSGGADPTALSLRRINEAAEAKLETLMEMYQREDAAALQRVRLSSHTSMSSWLPPDWVKGISKRYDEPTSLRGDKGGIKRVGSQAIFATNSSRGKKATSSSSSPSSKAAGSPVPESGPGPEPEPEPIIGRPGSGARAGAGS